MPNVKSAAKQARASERKRIRNHSVTSRIHTGLRNFKELLGKDPKAAKESGQTVISWLDRAVKSNIIHRNAARRHKARIMARILALAK